jgi:hypothetical protein
VYTTYGTPYLVEAHFGVVNDPCITIVGAGLALTAQSAEMLVQTSNLTITACSNDVIKERLYGVDERFEGGLGM